MKRRCKDSIFLKKIKLNNFKLTFRSKYRVADIEPKKNSTVPGALFEISKNDEEKIVLRVTDEGKGFKETSTKKIFDRFYSNRPDNFGEHSGLGLNIVKNLVDLHGATIYASNNIVQKGANVEISFPKI